MGTRNSHLQSWEHGLEMLEPCIFLSLPGLLYLHLFSFQPLPPFSAIFRQRVPASTYIRARVVLEREHGSRYRSTAEQRRLAGERKRNGAREKEGTKSKLGGGKARKREKLTRRGWVAASSSPEECSHRRVRLTLWIGSIFAASSFSAVSSTIRRATLTALS